MLQKPRNYQFCSIFQKSGAAAPGGWPGLEKIDPPAIARFERGNSVLPREMGSRPLEGFRAGAVPEQLHRLASGSNVVLRARDAEKLTQAKREIEGMLERVRRAQSSS